MAHIRLGASFSSLQDLETAIGNYEKANFINVYKRSSRSIESHRKRRPNLAQTANQDLVHAEIDYCCIHGGKNFKSHGTGQRPDHYTIQQRCPAGFRMRLSKDATQLVVMSLNEEHSHKKNEALFKYLPRQRRLDPAMEAEARRLLSLHPDKKLVQQQIREKGVEVTLKDLHNLKARMLPPKSNKLESPLVEMQCEEGAVKVSQVAQRLAALASGATGVLFDIRLRQLQLLEEEWTHASMAVEPVASATTDVQPVAATSPTTTTNDVQSVPVTSPTSTTSDVQPGQQEQLTLHLGDIKMPPPIRKRGRPKGAEVTVIGLPKKHPKERTRPVPFLKKSPDEKECIIIGWLVKTDVAGRALGGGDLIGAREVEKRPAMKCTGENVDLNRVRKFFTVVGWEALMRVVKKRTEKGVWQCKVCNGDFDSGLLSLGCDACLDWFHGRCVGISSASKKTTWSCTECNTCL